MTTLTKVYVFQAQAEEIEVFATLEAAKAEWEEHAYKFFAAEKHYWVEIGTGLWHMEIPCETMRKAQIEFALENGGKEFDELMEQDCKPGSTVASAWIWEKEIRS